MMIIPRYNIHVTAIIFLVALLGIAGCESTAPVTTPTDEAATTLYYPPLPNPPRIQYLTSLISSEDVEIEEKSGFGDFITGKVKLVKFPQKPFGIDVVAGKVYVTDAAGASYVVFDLAGNKYLEIFGRGAGVFSTPVSIKIDQDGTKYIADVGKKQVLVYDKDEKFLRALGSEGQFNPADVAIHGDSVYITDTQDHEIEQLDKHTGALIRRIGNTNDIEEESNQAVEGVFYPTGIEVWDNKLYVVETGNFRIKQYTLDGAFLNNYGGVGDTHGTFARPKSLAFDRDGIMYVVDAAFSNVQMFAPDGSVLMSFGGSGTKPGELALPAGIAIDYDNVKFFENYIDSNFNVEYLILVTSQFGDNKVSVYGFGKMRDIEYPEDLVPSAK